VTLEVTFQGDWKVDERLQRGGRPESRPKQRQQAKTTLYTGLLTPDWMECLECLAGEPLACSVLFTEFARAAGHSAGTGGHAGKVRSALGHEVLQQQSDW
jgi:hypothetical protein